MLRTDHVQKIQEDLRSAKTRATLTRIWDGNIPIFRSLPAPEKRMLCKLYDQRRTQLLAREGSTHISSVLVHP